MSDQINISPLLDGFTLGSPISEHHGVICRPAIKENSNKKYIVKTITVPATQAQFDALLLAGAYKDPADAMEYFRERGESILQEAELLSKLSKIEGFIPFEGWQMEPITRRRLGYEVYLVGSYKRSLDKYIKKNAITHLEAVNLAMDLCSSLSICRQSGCLYVNLKPSNIYVSEKKEYRIGDLGFLRLDSLRYASLPERYFSPYTPPELLDPMMSINLSVDTYAVGMILYQLYNDGQLPFSEHIPEDVLPSPNHADYEMAEIIMKAIHPDPEQRWLDPKDLGKAIASYMQRNSINDVPITIFSTPNAQLEDVIKNDNNNDIQDNSEIETTDPGSLTDDSIETQEETPETSEEAPTAEADFVHSEEESDKSDDITVSGAEEIAESEVIEERPISSENVQTMQMDQSHEQSSQEDEAVAQISDEVAQILNKANDIIAHEIPEATIFPVEEQIPDPFAFAVEETDDLDESVPADFPMEKEQNIEASSQKKHTKHFENPTRRNKIRKFLRRCFLFIILCAIAITGYWFYQNIYLQPIDAMSVSGTQDQITVLVDTSIEETKLFVYCSDGNGKRYKEAVQGGKAVFTQLTPSTEYAVEIDIAGFHKLYGNTSAVFTTEATTQIHSFQVIAGSEDGSVKLTFEVDGDEPDFWNIRYTADGEDEGLETITSHSAEITGLTVGKLYTFTLDGGKNFDFGGETSIQYLASKLILAEDITVSTSDDTDVVVHWSNPGDVVVESWTVRCYDGYGFEEQKTVSENHVIFTDLDISSNYTVEITAAGMTQSEQISITSDPIKVSGFQIDTSKKTEMKVSWEYTGNDPEDGWLLLYTVDGSGPQTIPCEKASAVISPLIPGAYYKFVLQAADDRTIFNNTERYQAADAEHFTEHNVKLETFSFDLIKTPTEADWSFETVQPEDYTDTFAVGESVSVVMQSTNTFYLPGNKTNILFVFRDSFGNVLPDQIQELSCNWKSIWTKGDTRTGELNIPSLPTTPGAYVMELYFNGSLVTQFDITIAG